MSSTTIRVHSNEKMKLEKLQARIFLSSGRKLSIPELMELLLKSNENEILSKILEELTVDEDIPWNLHLSLITDMEFDSSEDIDDILYG
jgi:hypothetical protein